MSKKISILLFIFLAVWLGVITGIVINLPKNTQTSDVNEITVSGFSTDLSKVVAANKSSIVSVYSGDSLSTGFIYKQVGNNVYVACCLHGIEDKEDIELIFHSGYQIKASLKDYNVFLDLALLECESNLQVKPVTIGDARLLEDGVFVVSVGTSGSDEYAFSSEFGIVASKYREVENLVSYEKVDYDYYASYIQLSGSFVEGFSGSPLINMNGEVVGMINSKDGDVILASSINEIDMVINKMLNAENYQRFNFGFSGLFVKEMENYEKTYLNIGLDTINGYYIDKVKVGSFAANIGLSKGDVILSINDYELNDFEDYFQSIYNMNDSYQIIVIRNNEKLKFEGHLDD